MTCLANADFIVSLKFLRFAGYKPLDTLSLLRVNQPRIISKTYP
jgi:hypothetical protein